MSLTARRPQLKPKRPIGFAGLGLKQGHDGELGSAIWSNCPCVEDTAPDLQFVVEDSGFLGNESSGNYHDGIDPSWSVTSPAACTLRGDALFPEIVHRRGLADPSMHHHYETVEV